MVCLFKASTTSTPCCCNNSDTHVSLSCGFTSRFLCLRCPASTPCKTLLLFLGPVYSILYSQDFSSSLKCFPSFSLNITHIYIKARITLVCKFSISTFPKVVMDRDSVFSTTWSGTKPAAPWVLNILLLSK